MKLYAPKYYKKFKCVAHKCDHNCCIGWEIDIDPETLEKYTALNGGYGEVIKESISLDGTPHFKLSDDDRCPHLDKNGLCRIISNLGEEYLCGICDRHPRFYNYTHIAEVGLGMSCREAARLVLSSSDYDLLEEIGEIDVMEEDVEFDGRVEREEIYRILRNGNLDYQSKLKSIYNRYSMEAGEDGLWLEIIDSLEYLDVDHKKLLMKYSSSLRPKGKDEYLERFLAYLIYRHTTEAFDREDFWARLSFCLFCERLFASLLFTEGAISSEDAAVIASIISEEIEYSDDNTLALTY